jgi:transcription antitermination factor NusG
VSTSSTTAECTNWYAVRVKSKFEKTVSTVFRHKGYTEFFPTYSETRQWSDRLKQIQKPLFPGYVFCRFDPVQRLPILMTPGVVGIAGFGKTPVAVEEYEIDALQTLMASGLTAEPWDYCNVGERVLIERGPLSGIEGIVVHHRGACRVVVSVTLLQRSVSAEIERTWIRPLHGSVGPRIRPVEGLSQLVQRAVPA